MLLARVDEEVLSSKPLVTVETLEAFSAHKRRTMEDASVADDTNTKVASKKDGETATTDSKGEDDPEDTSNYRDFSHVPPPTPSRSPLSQPETPKEPTFIVKLHQMLSNPELEDIISWLPHGRAWRILRRKTFEEWVIPMYFRHSRYSSFMRQVNGWGFRRITSGSDYNAYYHEMFLRGMPHLCDKMRRLTTRTGQGGEKTPIKQPDPDAEESAPDFYKISEVHPLPESTPVPRPMLPRFPGTAPPTELSGTGGLTSVNASGLPPMVTSSAAGGPSLAEQQMLQQHRPTSLLPEGPPFNSVGVNLPPGVMGQTSAMQNFMDGGMRMLQQPSSEAALGLSGAAHPTNQAMARHMMNTEPHMGGDLTLSAAAAARMGALSGFGSAMAGSASGAPQAAAMASAGGDLQSQLYASLGGAADPAAAAALAASRSMQIKQLAEERLRESEMARFLAMNELLQHQQRERAGAGAGTQAGAGAPASKDSTSFDGAGQLGGRPGFDFSRRGF